MFGTAGKLGQNTVCDFSKNVKICVVCGAINIIFHTTFTFR